MTLLSSASIRKALAEPSLEERLIVTPLLEPDRQIGPGSIDLRLGTEFIEIDRHSRSVSDPREAEAPRSRQKRIVIPLGQKATLHPGQFILGSTLEFVRIPRWLAGQVHSRSSWGRLGVLVSTAAAVQPGYAGMITLQLTNLATVPVHLYPGMRLPQLFLWKMGEAAESGYDRPDAKYWHPLGPQESRLPEESSELHRVEAIGLRLGFPQGVNAGAIPGG